MVIFSTTKPMMLPLFCAKHSGLIWIIILEFKSNSKWRCDLFYYTTTFCFRKWIYSFSIIWSSSAASEFDEIKVGEKTTYEKPGIFMVIKWNQTSFRRVFFCIKGNKRLLVISKKWIYLNLGSQRNFKMPFFASKNSGKAYSSI